MNIDYELLVKQKLTLLVLLENNNFHPEQKDHLDGIIHLIDHLQDLNEPL